MSLPPVPVIHINIQANTVLSAGRGRRVTQRNRVHHRVPVVETCRTLPEFTPHTSTTTGRRIEAQSRIRQKLEEVSAQSEGVLPRISLLALFATRILSVVEVCQLIPIEPYTSETKRVFIPEKRLLKHGIGRPCHGRACDSVYCSHFFPVSAAKDVKEKREEIDPVSLHTP